MTTFCSRSPFCLTLLSATTALLLIACGEAEPITEPGRLSTCIPNTTAPCLCLNGRAGVQTCQTDGSFSVCECPGDCAAGLVLADGVCTDLDECAIGADNCDPHAECRNGWGGFSCHCETGFDGDGVDCVDVDECTLGTDSCGTDAQCRNLAGTYACECRGGFEGDGYLCDDRDECALGTDTCDTRATCANTSGGYTCTCKDGYEGDGFFCGVAIDTPVADLSAHPIAVSFEGLGSPMYVEGLSRLTWELEIASEPYGPAEDGRIRRSPTRQVIPDIVMRNIRGSAAQTAELASWLQQGAAATPRFAVFTLEGAGGELVVLRVRSLVPVSSDTTITNEGAASRLATAVLRVSSFAQMPFSIDDVINSSFDIYGQEYAPHPGYFIEIAGFTISPGYQLNEIVSPQNHVSAPIFLPSAGFAEGTTDWMTMVVASWFYEPVDERYIDRRAMSVILLNATTETSRVNCFEAFPQRLDFFNPAKPYGTSSLLDLLITNEYCEDA